MRVNAIGPFAPLGRRKTLRVSISVAVLIEIKSRRVNQTHTPPDQKAGTCDLAQKNARLTQASGRDSVLRVRVMGRR